MRQYDEKDQLTSNSYRPRAQRLVLFLDRLTPQWVVYHQVWAIKNLLKLCSGLSSAVQQQIGLATRINNKKITKFYRSRVLQELDCPRRMGLAILYGRTDRRKGTHFYYGVGWILLGQLIRKRTSLSQVPVPS